MAECMGSALRERSSARCRGHTEGTAGRSIACPAVPPCAAARATAWRGASSSSRMRTCSLWTSTTQMRTRGTKRPSRWAGRCRWLGGRALHRILDALRAYGALAAAWLPRAAASHPIQLACSPSSPRPSTWRVSCTAEPAMPSIWRHWAARCRTRLPSSPPIFSSTTQAPTFWQVRAQQGSWLVCQASTCEPARYCAAHPSSRWSQ